MVNVEAQLDDPDSLLHWLQRTLSVRRELEALALGDFVDLEGDNAAVYVVARQWGDQRVIAAFNFSAGVSPSSRWMTTLHRPCDAVAIVTAR